MKYPKYCTWCKQNVIETIKKQRIDEDKDFLKEFVFNPDSDLYSIHDYKVSDILWIINGNNPDDLSKTLFSAIQHAFAEKYFQKTQEMNPEMDMKKIRHNGSEYMDLLYRALEDITIDELKDAVMYAFDHGTEEVKESKIPYVKTNTENIGKVINSNLVEIESVHINYLDPDVQRKDIPMDKFIDYLMHLSQSGIFANTINWRYVDLFDSGKFLVEGDIGHNNGYELNIGILVKNKENKDRVIEILREREK